MGVDITLNNVGNGYNRSAINDNFDAIEVAFDDAVSITNGATMEADLDLNSNDLLNGGIGEFTSVTINGVNIVTEGFSEGDAGWSPVFAIVTDGARRVLQLTSYIGGEGTVPTDYIDYYVGATEMEVSIGDGVDIRGAIGASGAGSGDMVAAQNLSDVDDAVIAFTNIKQTATTTSTGVVELATPAEALAASDTDRAVPPYALWLPPGFLYGCTLSNNTTDAVNDIDIAAGKARSSVDTDNIYLASALTKRLDATWAVGTNQGGLDTGSIANGIYHVHLIKRVDTNVVDVLFSTSFASPTLPTNYTVSRRIGSFVRSSGSILPFIQEGDFFRYKTPIKDCDIDLGPSYVDVSLTVPTGLRVMAILNVTGYNATSDTGVNIKTPDASDGVPSVSLVPGAVLGHNLPAAGQMRILTDTSGRVSASFNRSTSALRIFTVGYEDSRGRLG